MEYQFKFISVNKLIICHYFHVKHMGGEGGK